jgi:hypothetical protein
LRHHKRLARLESIAWVDAPKPETAPSSRRWLAILDTLSGFARENGDAAATALLREAAELLRDYVKSGSAWYHTKPGDRWHGVPCPLADETAHFRQCLQIDAWRAAPAEAERLQQLVTAIGP